MCGIAGLFRFDPAARVEPSLVEAMGDALAHRGPDASGTHVAENVGLAHRRLSIIDLAGGRQPIFSEDGMVAAVFNGEIYNYEALTSRLAGAGHCFSTRSDGEVLVHAYEERGDECVRDLRGMFAFAIWDQRRRRVLVARDRLGIKPLYYYAGRDFLAFASEIKALLVCPGVPREIDPEALDLYLSLRYVPGPRTMFRGIRKLEPGHVLVCDRQGPLVRRYWDLPRSEPRPFGARERAEAAKAFEAKLEETVKMHLMSEVPLGVFLSGGLDSTAMLALVSRVRRGERVRTFTVGYEPASFEAREANEFAYARLAAESFGAEHHEIRLGDADFLDFLPDLVWHLDEPLADPACVPLYFVSKLARSEITVVLSGEGADEILGGYGIYQRMLALERLHGAAGKAIRALAPRLARLAHEPRLRNLLELAGQPLERRYRGVSRGCLPAIKRRLLGARAGGGDALLDELFDRRYDAVRGAPALDRMLYVDTKVWLPDDLLVKADKMTMANSQELRVPFLDHEVVEMAARLPPEAKLHGGVGKSLLRTALAGAVPQAIVERSKKGFPVPTVPLLRRASGATRELLLASDSACRDWFEPAVVGRLLDEHDRGRARWDQEIWSLLLFEIWNQVFVARSRGRTEQGGARTVAAAVGS